MDIIAELSTRLLKFKKSGNTYNFRCPYCGDSNINSFKARGYIFKSKLGNYAIKCHNCQISKSLNNFLKDNFPDLFNNYIYSQYRSKYESSTTGKLIKSFEHKIFKPDIFNNYSTVFELHKTHPAKQYLLSRKLPQSFFKEVFFVTDFKNFTNLHKHTYNNLQQEESRLVVPLIIDDRVVGYQGRLFGATGIRYLTIMLSDAPKIYNVDNINFNQPIYVTEGIYDSIFVPNCIAMLGSDIMINFAEQYENSKFVFLYDNEPYSHQIINRMKKTVGLGHSVCIWQKSIIQKDLNDCVLAGVDILPILSNKYSGTRALLEINQFSKV